MVQPAFDHLADILVYFRLSGVKFFLQIRADIHQRFMFRLMRVKTGKSGCGHFFFFMSEMLNHIRNQIIELRTYR